MGEEEADEDEIAEDLDSSEEEESSATEPDGEEPAAHVLKLLYKWNMEEANRSEEQARKAKVFNRRHNFYKGTRCTSTAQEEQSALFAGVINVNEDSSDEEDCFGEQKELAKEAQGLCAAAHWVNQEGWDTAAEGKAVSRNTGKEIDLRLDWARAHRKLQQGSESGVNS